MLNPSKGILFVVLFLIPFLAETQQPELSFRNYNIDNGLAGNYVKNIIQDSRGFIWISTNDGLSRFDGNSFKNYHHSTGNELSLRSDNINHVVEFKKGHLLICTHGGSICLNTFTNSFYKPSDTLLRKAGVWSFAKDNKGGIWLTFLDYLLYVDSNLNVVKRFEPPEQTKEYFTNVIVTKDQIVIVTIKNHFYAFLDTRTNQFVPLQEKFKEKLPEAWLLFYDAEHNQLIGSLWQKTVYALDLDSNNIHYWDDRSLYKNIGLNDIPNGFRDRENNVWLAKAKNGLLYYDRSKNNITHIVHDDKFSSTLISNEVTFIYEDHERNIWIGTNNGLSKLSKKMRQFNIYRQQLTMNGTAADIMSIKRGSDDKVYVATLGNGSFSLNTLTGESKIIDKKVIPSAWCINTVGDSIAITGHSDKILYYNTASKKLTTSNIIQPFYDTADLVVFEFRDSYGDNWWSINKGHGLIRQPHNTNTFEHYYSAQTPSPFAHRYFMSIKEDESGNIWLASNRSYRVVCWIRRENKFLDINPFDLKQHDEGTSGITALLPDKKGNVWIATYGTGLMKYNIKLKTVESYTTENGLSSNAVYSLAMDNNDNLWIGTSKGINCLPASRNEFFSFSKADGLPANDFNENAIFFDSIGNRMYMPSGNILMSFVPDSLLGTSSRLPVYIDEILVNGSKKDLASGTLDLRFRENNLQVNFTTVDLSSSHNVMFAYKLEGADDDWKYTTTIRSAVYDALPPGDYKFYLKVKKAEADGWNELAAPLQITIHPVWWQSWWFRTVIILLALAFAYFMFRIVVERKLEKQRILFEKQKAIETERARISSELHDDLGGGLSNIRLLSEMIKDDAAANTSRLNKISESSKDLVQKMNEIVWALNMNNDNLQNLLAYVREYSVKFLDDANIECCFEMPDDIPSLVVEGTMRRNIFLLIKEALHNVVKHAAANKVELTILFESNLVISVKDNGIGFNKMTVSASGNGFRNMKRRALELGGSFEIYNHIGTTCVFEVPFENL